MALLMFEPLSARWFGSGCPGTRGVWITMRIPVTFLPLPIYLGNHSSSPYRFERYGNRADRFGSFKKKTVQLRRIAR
jgi:hypothetical protein